MYIICRCQRGLCRGTSNTTQHQNSPLTTGQGNNESRLTVTYTKNKGPAPQPYNIRTLPPPALPPRAINPVPPVSSSRLNQSQGITQENSPPRHNEQTSVITPLGRSHSAVMTSNLRMYFYL